MSNFQPNGGLGAAGGDNIQPPVTAPVQQQAANPQFYYVFDYGRGIWVSVTALQPPQLVVQQPNIQLPMALAPVQQQQPLAAPQAPVPVQPSSADQEHALLRQIAQQGWREFSFMSFTSKKK